MSKLTYEIDLLNNEYFKRVESDDKGQKSRWYKMIPCNCPTCKNITDKHFYNYGKLLERKEFGKDTIECEKRPFTSVQISALLDGVFSTTNKSRVTSVDMDKKFKKVFISYAHRDKDYFKVFVDELSEFLNNNKRYSFSKFDDRQLILGSDWNDKLEQEVDECEIGILLFSPAFLNSPYIEEKELGAMLEKLKQKKDFIICPIYFKSFDFDEFNDLKKFQFFKPDGDKYGHADKGTNLCFANLVEFNNVNGINMPTLNPSRDSYLLDFSKALLRALDEKSI